MKIILPNPMDSSNNDDFFDQLELAIYHARKSWDKIKTRYTALDITEKNDTPYIKFKIPVLDEKYLSEKVISGIIDCNLEQEIIIEIVEL